MHQERNQRIVRAVRSVVGDARSAVALHEPTFAGNEWEYVRDCLDTGWVSSVGAYVDRFERQLAEICGVEHAVATVNGTAALHAALLTLGVGPEDEVLLPTLTFVATANAVAYTRAVPHFVDSDRERLGIDAGRLADYLADVAVPAPPGNGRSNGRPRFRNRRTGRRLRAVVPVHIFGHPVDMDRLSAVAETYGLDIVEDAAEGLGSTYKQKPLGSLGRIGILSFNGNKVVTTGGGGAALTSDRSLAERLRHLGTTAKKPSRWAYEHDQVGYNYRLPNINAALGCAQLEQLDGLLERKRRLAEAYRSAFRAVPEVTFLTEPADSRSNYWLNAIRLEGPVDAAGRDGLLGVLHEAGLLCRPVWQLMHELPMYAGCPAMECPVAEDLAVRMVNLPSSPGLVPDEAARVRCHRIPC